MLSSMSGKEQEVDPKLALDYGGKVHRALEETGRRLNQVLLGQTALSFACASIALDQVSPPSAYTVTGLEIGLSLPTILTGASLIISCLLMYQVGLVHHEERLRSTLERIYAALGFDDESMEDALASPLEHPGLATIVLAQARTTKGLSIAYRVTRVFVILLFLGVPLFSQALVAYRLTLLGLLGWLVPIGFGFFLSVWHLIIYIRRERA